MVSIGWSSLSSSSVKLEHIESLLSWPGRPFCWPRHSPKIRDNLNINTRREDQIKKKGGGGDLKNVLGQKWQPVITNYECPKQLLTVEKHQYNFPCSFHLYIKQNRTFLITNLSNVNTKSVDYYLELKSKEEVHQNANVCEGGSYVDVNIRM